MRHRHGGGIGGGLCVGLWLLCAPVCAADPRGWAVRAVEEAEAVADARARLAVYRELMPALGRVKEPELIERLAAAGVRLARTAGDRVGRSEICAAAALAYALAGRREPHERWMLDAIAGGAWPDRRLAWPALARARLDGGDADGAGQLATALEDASDRAICLADLAGIAARQGDTETAFDFLRLAMANVKAGDRPDQALERVVDAQAAIGDRRGAEETVARIAPGYWRARAAARVAQVALLEGDGLGYRQFNRVAVDAAVDGIHSSAGRAAALLAISRMRADAGDAGGAKDLAVAARAHVALVPAGERGGLQLAVAGVLSRAGDAAGAAEAGRAARELFSAGVRSDLAAEDAVASLVAGGLLADALAAAADIANADTRGRALARVAEGYEAAGDVAALAAMANGLDTHGWAAARSIGRAHARLGQGEALEALATGMPDPAARSGLWAGAAEGRWPKRRNDGGR